MAASLDAKSGEDAFGRINPVLALAAIVVAVFKPELCRRSQPASPPKRLGTSSTS